jgi:exodeoxyribonuclease VII large subunit
MVYTLQDLNAHIRQVIALNFREPIWITAEIAEANLSRGHLYLALVQKGASQGLLEDDIVAQAQAIVWQRDRRRLVMEHGQLSELVLSAGVQARLLVRVDYHERYGLKLHIENIDPAFSMGIMALQRRQTIDALRKDGLLHLNNTLPLPLVLQRIAVITSQDAAGFHDFKTHLEENSFGYTFRYQCFFAAVQGRNAEPEICAALNHIALAYNNFDVVVIIRGGGARLDLSAFDSLEVGKMVAAMPLPVFSGIGHEIDESVLDMVAHTAFKTPTAVADFLIERALRFESLLVEMATHVSHIGQRNVRYALESLQFAQNIVQSAAERSLAVAHNNLASYALDIPVLARQRLKEEQRHLDQLTELAQALAPETTLLRGFSITLKNEKAVLNVAELKAGDRIQTRLGTGNVDSVVA